MGCQPMPHGKRPRAVFPLTQLFLNAPDGAFVAQRVRAAVKQQARAFPLRAPLQPDPAILMVSLFNGLQ